MIQLSPAPVPPSASEVVLSRTEAIREITHIDTPLVLTKGATVEQAVLRQQLFLSISTRLVRTADPSSPPVCRWIAKALINRETCFSSVSGLFSCTLPQQSELIQQSAGEEAPQATQDPVCEEVFAPAAAAIQLLSENVRALAPNLFEEDRRTSLEPLLKASGVKARKR